MKLILGDQYRMARNRSRKRNTRKNRGKPLFNKAYSITMNENSERYKQSSASAQQAGVPVTKWDAVKVDDTMGDSLMEQGIGSMIFNYVYLKLQLLVKRLNWMTWRNV